MKQGIPKNMNKEYPLIKTRSCLLRLPAITEVELMYDFIIRNRSHLSKWEPLQSDSYYTKNSCKERIEKIHEDFLADKSCCLNIYTTEDNTLVGMLNFNNFIRGCFHSCFLGFKISKNMQGKGLMTECMKASIHYVFDELNLHRISANYMLHNSASAKVLEKCRFKHEGIAKDYLYINSKWEDHALTSLINKKWRPC